MSSKASLMWSQDFPFTWEIQKFMLEKQTVDAVSFRELQKTWAIIWGMQFFHSF